MRRDSAYKKYKRLGSELCLNSFKFYRNKTTKCINQAKQKFYFRDVHNSRNIWKSLKTLGVSRASIEAKVLFSAKDILNEICKFCVSLGVLPLPDTDVINSDNNVFVFDCVDELMVLNAIHAVKSDSLAFDLVNLKLLKLFIDLF